MSLSINPLSTLVAKVTSETQAAIQAAEAAVPQIQNALEKAKIDELVGKYGGAIGSGLNQATATGVLADAGTAMGQASSTITSKVGADSITSLSANVGDIGQAAAGAAAIGDKVKSIGGAAAGALSGAEISSTLSSLTGGSLAGGAQNIAGLISKGAGALNDFLSLKRGENIPKDGELFSQSGSPIALAPSTGNDWRVRINCDWSIFNSPLFDRFKNGGVVFPYQPEITFSTKANYSVIDPVHNNYPFQAYKNSQVDDISIVGKFTAETEKDAAYWIAATTFFKTATKMFFGQGSNVGAPPVICILNGYGSNVFDNVPVVVKSFSVDFPQDVNYVKCTATGSPTWVPIISSITVMLTPVYNRRNLRQFSLAEYAKGSLKTPTGQGYI